MANEIINLTVHELRRAGDGFQVRLREGPLPVTELTQKVVDDLHDLYRKRSSKAHGRFSENDADYPTRSFLLAYADAGSTEVAFADLTSRMMTTLEVQARRRPNAGGGHVLFAHFSQDGREHLLVSIVTQKWGARLTNELDMRAAPHIDMEGFRFAGRISLTGWREGESRYIGFLKGKGDVAEYFKEFLGCDDTVLVKQDTQTLVDVFNAFADDQALIGEARETFLRDAKAICDRSARSRNDLDFTALANELVPNGPEALLAMLNDPDRNLSDGFVPNAGVLNLLVKFKARTTDWTLEFNRDAINNGSVEYLDDERTLVIRNLPDDLVVRLRHEFAPDAAA